MKKRFLEVGEIVASHGLGGEVKVYPWCDSPDFILDFSFLYLNSGSVRLEVERARVNKNTVIIKLKNYDDVEQTMQLRKKVLYIDRQDVSLGDGTFFVQDLLGLEIVDVDTGVIYGNLSEVSKTGANDVYHVKKNGKEVLIPAIPDVIIDTDISGGIMKIRPLNGLFEPEELHGGEKNAL